MTNQQPAAVVEALVETALHARVPGGAEVWCFLPQKDAFTPSETARSVIRSAIKAALAAAPAPVAEPARGEADVTEAWHRACGDCVNIGNRPWCVMNCSSIPNDQKARL